MQIARNKTTATTIALLLMLTMAIPFVALPTANAQSTKTTYAFIGATPNPVGVGQETLVHVGISDAIAGVAYGWEGLTVTVTRPDGTTETLGPFRSDSTGGTGTVYVPSVVGTYYLQTNFPQQKMPITSAGVPANTTMLASVSEKLALNVTQEPKVIYPGVPLPTEYWTRPINAQFREWYTVAGSWLTVPDNRFAPYNEGPETPHILWAKPLALGGLVGGELGLVGSGGTSVAMETGDAYEGFFSGSVILAGKLYYNRFKSSGGTNVEQEVVAVDLHTGEELWVRNWNNTRLAFGQLFYWQSYNYQGTFAYLWTTSTVAGSTVWDAYNALTGRWEYRMVDVPGGTSLYGPRGEIYRYQIDLTNGWMMLWNSSRVGSTAGSFGSAVLGNTFNVSAIAYTTRPRNGGYEWNKTISKGLPGSASWWFLQDRVVGTRITSTEVNMWGLSLKPGQEGTLLFNKTWTPPPGNITLSTATASLVDGVFCLRAKELRAFYGFSLGTGEFLWGPTESRPYLDLYMGGPSGERGIIAYGKLYTGTMAGVLHCTDVKTGKLLWTYEVPDPYTEILFSHNWPIEFGFVTDGKVYLFHTVHSENQPMPRGAPFICLNATTGEEIFRVNGLIRATTWGGDAMIGDSIIAEYNTYDQLIYAIGKGPSATTVIASPKVSVHGSSVLIEGTVTDESPGAKEYALTARFPSGVPAVADDSVGEWMKYVYVQFPRPANAKGVEVTLDTVDPNGNWIHIGTATSDSSGMFKKAFTPEVPGEYTVIATFPGSKSYYASFAETAINVEEAPPAPAAPEPPAPLPPYETYTIGTGIAIIAAVAIVGLMILRKKP